MIARNLLINHTMKKTIKPNPTSYKLLKNTLTRPFGSSSVYQYMTPTMNYAKINTQAHTFRKHLKVNFSVTDYLKSTWPMSKYFGETNSDDTSSSSNPGGDSSSGNGGENGDGNQVAVKQTKLIGVKTKDEEKEENPYTVYTDQQEVTYVSDSDFQMRIKSFSWSMIRKNYDTILYLVYKAWIEDNVEYIVLIFLFMFL